MKEEVKVSIIIPVYNVKQYIGNCLRSVMRQTYNGLMECLIIDDCGTDESIAIAEKMIVEYNDNRNFDTNENEDGGIRFRILRHEHNRGLSAARNTGTEHATGEYIYYLDSDDEITDDCIEKMLAVALKDLAIEMVQGKYDINGDNIPYPIERKDQITQVITNRDVRYCFYHRQINVCAWNRLIKRSFLFQHYLSFKEGILYEDGLWSFYLMKYISNVYFLSDITYHHRIRPNSIMTGTSKKKEAYHRRIVCQDIITHLTPGFEAEEYRLHVRGFLYHYCRYVNIEQTFQKVFPLYWKKAWHLKLYICCLFLVIGYILGKFKYGWVAIWILIRLKHSKLLIRDIRHRLAVK